jgi:hypothetical protein
MKVKWVVEVSILVFEAQNAEEAERLAEQEIAAGRLDVISVEPYDGQFPLEE